MTIYRAESTEPVAVECEVFEYPHKDADGETIFVNTHFATAEAAWEQVLSTRRASVRLRVMDVRERRIALAKAEAALTEEALKRDAAEENFEDWQRRERRGAS